MEEETETSSMNNWSYNPGLFFLGLCIILVALCWLTSPTKEDHLIMAARNNDTNSVVTLIKNGSDVNTATKTERKTPLMVAASNGNVETVKLLLQMGADKRLRDAHGKTARVYAQERNWTNIVNAIGND